MDSLSSFWTSLNRFRASANGLLSEYEPLTLLLAPIFSLLFARILQSFLHVVNDKGLKATLLGFLVTSIKYFLHLQSLCFDN